MKEPIKLTSVKYLSSYISQYANVWWQTRRNQVEGCETGTLKKKRSVIEIGSDTSDRICHTVGNQFYLTNGEKKCHHARSFQSSPSPQQQIEQSVSGQVALILKPHGGASYHHVSSPPLLLVVWYLVMARNMTQPSVKQPKAAESGRFKPLPPFKVWRTLIFPLPHPPLQSSGNAPSQK